jgi:glucoamylase
LESILYLKNRKAGATRVDEEIAIDFLQLVRFGLRSPKDALIRDSVTVADALLRVDTPNGPTWHRYNGDGYGEPPTGGRLTALAAAARGRF